MRSTLTASAALLAALAASPAAAADWEFKLTPYLWATGLEGEIGVFPRLPPVTVNESFADILDQLTFAAMGTLEARTGKFGVLGDIIYVDTDTSATIPDRRFVSVSLGTKSTITTLATAWRIAEQRRLDVDMLVGVRLMWTETDLTLRRDDGLTLSAKPDDMWMDPIAGVRGIYQLSPHWSITAYGDVGSGASDLTWQAYGAANYQVNDCMRLLAGWRHLKDDFDDDGFVYDVTMDGPMLGASFSF
jgi:hypothetical protein